MTEKVEQVMKKHVEVEVREGEGDVEAEAEAEAAVAGYWGWEDLVQK